MISSETKILLKRSGVPGRIPSLADLKLGELGINYYDGKVYLRQENDVVGSRIIEPGQGDDIGRTIFVTVNGNDNNSGLNERDSVRTIKKAAELAQFGDGIKVYPGQYIEDNPITFRDLVAVEGMDLRNVLVTPANPEKDLYLVGDGFHATNHSFVSNQDSRDAAAIISFRPLEGTASDRYFDAARLIRDNLNFISGEAVGFLTSGYSGFAAGQRSQDAARAIELNTNFISEESFQYINSPDYRGPAYTNPDINQCRSDLKDILAGWRYDLISDGNSESTGVGLTYYAPVKFTKTTNITDLVYDNTTGLLVIETELSTQSLPGDEIKLRDIQLDCPPYGNSFLIAGFDYDNVSGVGTVTLPFIHDIQAGDTIKLDDLKFDCPPYGAQAYSVSDFVYDETTGGSTVTLSSNHNLKVGDAIELRDMQFDCPAYGGTFSNVVNIEYNNVSGEAILTYADAADLDAGDVVLLYDIKLSCPAYGNAISITGFDYDNFTGITQASFASPHGLRVGDLVKFENLKFSCESYLSDTYNIVGFEYNNLTGEALASFSSDHNLAGGSNVVLDNLTFACNSYFPEGINVTGFNYTNTTGVSTISLDHAHNLQIGDRFQLEDLVFACNSYSFTDIDVTAATYDNVTGFVNITLAAPHGSSVGEFVKLDGIEYSCPGGSGITTTIFPDGTIGDQFEILSVPSPSALIVNVGPSAIPHSYVGGGTATVGITTTVFPDGTQGNEFVVTDLVDSLTLVTNVGVSTIAHTYAGSGKIFVGFTTTVFPDGTQGNVFPVLGVPAANQIALNVGTSTIEHTYVGGGTASNEDTFLNVSGFTYNDADGTGLVTLGSNHNLVVGDSFILEDLKFTCDSYRNTASTFDISDFQYDNVTGLSTVVITSSHDLRVNDTIALYDIEFSCPNGSGITTTIFPDGSVDNFYDVVAVIDPNTIITRIGTSTIPHSYVQGGLLQVGITTNIFPDGTRPSDNFFDVVSVPAPNQILTNVGLSSIAHTYASGGKFYTGITTNIFPQTFEDPNVKVVNAVYDNVTGAVTVTCDKPHGLLATNTVLLQGLEFSCASGGPGGAPGVLLFPRNQETYEVVSVATPTTYTINVGPNSIPHTYVSGGISTPQNIIDAVYNRANGELTVTLNRQHGYVAGDTASVVDLVFSCLSGGEGNAPGELIFPRPTDEFVLLSISGSEFTVNVGESSGLPHTYVNGGSVSYAGTTAQVTSALYNEETGVLTVTTSAPLGAAVDNVVTMQGLNFACNSGGPGNDPGTIIFPRLDVPVFKVSKVISGVTYVINVGTSTLAHTYVSGGFSSLKKKVNDNNLFRVLGVPTPNTVVTNVGVSSIPHTYVSGGNGFVGITTNIFPDGTRPNGSRFEVLSVLSPNKAVINVGVSTIPHFYESGGQVQYGETNERPILAFDYNNLTGGARVTVRGPHGLSAGDSVKFDGMEFECVNSPGITTTIFPDGTAASLNLFPVTGVVNNTVFDCNVGRVPFTHTYIQGGSAFVGITTNIFPDGTQGYNYTVTGVPSSNKVNVNVGVSSIQHNYVRGGALFAGETNERDIVNFSYDNESGLAILTLRQPEDLYTGNLVKLKGLEFDCPDSTAITTNIFPDGSQGFLFPVTERLNPTQFQLNIGRSTIQHNYVRGTGAAFVGITTDIFPDLSTQPTKLFNVVSIPSPNTVAVQVGTSTIPHNYESGGTLSVGINTDIFPGSSVVSPLGDTFVIDAVTSSGEIVINVGTSSITHNYERGGQVLYGQSSGGELQHITGPGVMDATIAAIDFERQMSKYVLNNRPWGSFIAAETGIVNGIDYDNVTGFATVTVPGINAQRGDMVRMSDIQFVCSDEYAGLTTTFFPDNTRPEGQYFEVESRIDENSFETFIGISSIKHNHLRGGNVYRYRQGIENVIYDRASGLASVTSMAHGYKVDDIIEMGDIRFTCPVFTPDYDIENFTYDNTTGLSQVTTTVDNDIQIGDLVRLDDIQLDCPAYGNERVITDFEYNNLNGYSEITVASPHGLQLNPRTPVAITTAVYDNVSGIVTVTTAAPLNIDLSINNGVQLTGLGFTCSNSTTTTNVVGAVYDNTTGVVRITTNAANNAAVSSKVKLQNLIFSCESGGVPSDQAFPSGVDGFDFLVSEVISATEFNAIVGVSTLTHTYVTGGTAQVGITTNIFPSDDTLIYPITNIESSTKFSLQVGPSAFAHTYTGGGDATKVNRYSVKLADIKFDCPAYGNDIGVTNFIYDNTSGNSLVTVDSNHGLNVGDSIKLANLKFQCPPYGNQFNVIAADYDNVTGIITVTTDRDLDGISVDEVLRLRDLQFDCNSGTPYAIQQVTFDPFNGRIATLSLGQNPQVNPGDLIKLEGLLYRNAAGDEVPYPDGRDASYNIFEARSVTQVNASTWEVTVQFNNITDSLVIFIPNGSSYGTLFTGVTGNIFPENVGPEGGFYNVLSLPSPNQFAIQVGTSTIPHTYIRNGEAFSGVTTNFFPSTDPQNSPLGNLFEVVGVPTPNQVRINVGVSSISHIYDSGGQLLVGITTNIFPDGTQGNLFPVVSIGSSTELRVNVGTSSIPHNYISGGLMFVGITTNIFPGDPQNSPLGNIFEVLGKDDDCGKDRFTINVGVSTIPHAYVEGGTVTTGVTTSRFPDGTNGFEFPVESVLDADTFVVNVGPSSISHTYVDGGYSRRLESPINSFLYDNVTGFADVGITSHRLNVGDLVKLRDIKFDCDPYGGEKFINNVVYNNLTGRLNVNTIEPHGLSLNETIKLSGIQMDCPAYGNQIAITGASYSNTTGVIDVTVTQAHNLSIGDSVKLDGLDFVCPGGSGITTTIFPDGTAASYNIYEVVSVPAANSLTVNVGTSTIPHTYTGGGNIFVGITTNIFPGSAQNSPRGSFFEVLDTPSITEFTLNVGVSSIAHGYIRGGFVQTGVTTDIFPDGTQGDYFQVGEIIDEDNFTIDAGISSITHRYNSGGYGAKYVTYQARTPQVVDTSVIRVSGGCKAAEARVDQLAGIVTSIIQNGPSAAPGDVPLNVVAASYNKQTGDLSVTTSGETGVAPVDTVKIENLIFQCSKVSNVIGATYDNTTGKAIITTDDDNGISIGTKIRLEGLNFACNDGSLVYPSDPNTVFDVIVVLGDNRFELDLAKSTKVHTWTGGGVCTTVPTTRTFPDNKVFIYNVKSVLSPTTFTVNVGPSDIDHSYISGGHVSPGLRYQVDNAEYNKITGLLTVTTDVDNQLIANTGVKLNDLQFSCTSGGANNQPGILPFPDGRPANVVAATYNNVTGLLRVTTDKPHQAYADVKVRLEGLEFSCPGGSLIYPSNPNQLLRVTKVEDFYTYEVLLEPSSKVHTYVQGGTSSTGTNHYCVDSVINSRTFTVQMAPNNLTHTYVSGGTVASVFCEQILTGINLRTAKCADDVKKIYLAVVHDVTRGGNMKSVAAARKYYDAVGQYQHIAGGEVNQTVAALDYSLNVVRCVINNVSWGGVPRGYFTSRERAFIPTKSNLDAPLANRSLSRDLLRLADMPPSTTQSVVCIEKPFEKGQYTTNKKFIEAFDYDNVTGIASVTTTQAHRLIKYDAIRLDDIKMRCVGSPRITTNLFPDGTQGDIFEVKQTFQDNPIYPVSDATYNNTTGNLLVESLGSNLELEVGTLVNLRNLRFECSSSGAPGTIVYPTNSDYVYEVKKIINGDTILVNVGVSTLVHTFVPTSTTFNVPQFQELPRKFIAHVGTVGFPHIYEQGGTVWKQEPFQTPESATQLRDVSIQNDPLQFTNSTPNACANVFSAIENTVGVVTTIIDVGFEDSGISVRYPGNDGRGVDSFDQMSSQGVGNIIRGPYIRNCTNFVPKSIGMRMDGFDAEPGDEISNGVQGSSNVDSFTQFNPGGIGCSVSNGTYQQLVSIFTICCDQAIVCDSGAQLDLTNSNSSFGRLGLVARGIGDAKSKCIDRYTGIVAEEAQIEDDTVIIRGVGEKRPYDGQGIFFGELFREVIRIDVTDGGSGYDDENPPVATVDLPTGPSGIKAEVSPTVLDGEVVSIELISNGNQYRDISPTVTIAPPRDPEGRQAKAVAITEPIYYDVDSSSAPVEGTVRVVFKQRLNNTVSVGTTVFFSRLSLQIASSHSFEYIGSGNEINGARPSQGGVPIKANEIVKQEGGSIVYTSTDQAGNFNIGDDFVINQFTGTVTGRSFDQSVLNKVTPLIIALDS
ncbi:hypothetical protein BOW86_gp208 [Synechococcus phage S-CAM7]|uniref:Uncharacterized protein n=1 Tax=Synechococcus phage S-CAM7 TaxID=1883368 RepID=A0A1D8KU73_9CAUD|nr:hypothetical protein BOW86_gp208 [Synechococcus phage S-CAM7]AOV62173.1 hypothetical protein C490910_250 [Synechococcus phage S-CAM7]